MSQSNSVNDKLHSLRGQHWRQSNNASRTRPNWSLNSATRFTLPRDLTESINAPNAFIRDTFSGPNPPKSWVASKSDIPIDYQSVHGRKRALSLLLQHLPDLRPEGGNTSYKVPSLVHLCLETVAASFVQPDLEEVILFLPMHLRILLYRLYAVYEPTYPPKAGKTGESFIFGPKLIKSSSFRPSDSSGPNNWDTEDDNEEAIYALAIVNANIPPSPILYLPVSLTHLALVHVNGPLPLHRIFTYIPQAVFIDLSYNDWLASATRSTPILQRITWKTLGSLKALGFRGCEVEDHVMRRINAGRWNEVTCIHDASGIVIDANDQCCV